MDRTHWEYPKTYPFHCTLDTWKRLAHWEYSSAVYPIPMYHGNGWIPDWEYTSASHPTLPRKWHGHTGNIPACTTLAISTIPLFHGKDWTHWECISLSYHYYALCSYCPSHPTVPWEGLDTLGMSQSVCPYCFVPTVHPIPLWTHWEGWDRLVHSQSADSFLPMVQWGGMDSGKGGMHWDIPSVSCPHAQFPPMT